MHLREVLSNLSPPLERLIDGPGWCGTRIVAPIPTNVLQSGVGQADTDRVRLHLHRRNHKLKPAEIDALVAAYLAGETKASLARRFDLHEHTVRAHLDRRDVYHHPVPIALTIQQRQRIAKLFRDGRSRKEIAELLGVSERTVGRVLRSADVTRDRSGSDAAS